LRDNRNAEDVVQETFVKVYIGCNSVRSFQSLRGWIFTIARNEAFGILRKTKIEFVEDDGQVWESETPLELLVRSEVKDIVQHFLGELKPEYREVLILREYEDLSYAELAIITSSTESAVKSRLFKARKALVKKLQPFFEEREFL
jgi:RNA polymerase sigma-70 factor (ECF subfamily)